MSNETSTDVSKSTEHSKTAESSSTKTDRLASKVDSYKMRVSKYIPGEVLAAYVAMSGIVASMDQKSDMSTVAWWFVFAVGVVLTPIYLIYVSKLKTEWLMHAVISTIAFVVWAYAMGGPFKTIVLEDSKTNQIIVDEAEAKKLLGDDNRLSLLGEGKSAEKLKDGNTLEKRANGEIVLLKSIPAVTAYQPQFGSILLIIFTLVVGLICPKGEHV